MLVGWRERGIPAESIRVVEPDAEAAGQLAGRYGIATVPRPEALPRDFRPTVVVFAVKPQVMDKVAPQ